MTTGEALDGGQQRLGGTSTWDEFTHAVANYMMVARLADATSDQVRDSRSQFRAAEGILAPHRERLNVQTAGYVVERNEQKRATWTGRADQRTTKQGEDAWARAQALAKEHTFFHWPLEFPEAWYGLRPGTERTITPRPDLEAGFDAVVGNPPWGTEVTSPASRPVLAQRFAAYSDDAFTLFLQQAGRLCRANGHVGQILPSG